MRKGQQQKPSKKRTRVENVNLVDISEDFLNSCEKKFKDDPINIVARNAIVSVGSMFSTINSNRVNELSYVFMNTVKKKNLKATNQGHSGRCWMFAALNTFRHLMIKALDLENFEFSETYLFFWDKLERCNSYIRWFIDHPNEELGGRAYDYMLTQYMCDGGWWNTFANLVNKYGVIPKECMTETASSLDSDDMNKILKEHIDSCVNYIAKNRKKHTKEKLLQVKNDTMTQVYNTLVKFLGEPPKKFNWSFINDGENGIVADVTPHMFLEMVAPEIDMNRDFISLSHIPTQEMKMYKTYRIKSTNNVYEGENCTLFNVPIEELAKYAMQSIASGIAVWFVGDVSKSFNWYHSALDDELDDHKTVFGELHKFDKGDRINLRNVQGNHAMALTGFNVDQHGDVMNWQVENSWGYINNEEPGLDGFLIMSHSWFKKYVMEVVINKNFLSRTMKKKAAQTPVDVEPWESMAPATRVGVVNAPRNYLQRLKRRE